MFLPSMITYQLLFQLINIYIWSTCNKFVQEVAAALYNYYTIVLHPTCVNYVVNFILYDYYVDFVEVYVDFEEIYVVNYILNYFYVDFVDVAYVA